MRLPVPIYFFVSNKVYSRWRFPIDLLAWRRPNPTRRWRRVCAKRKKRSNRAKDFVNIESVVPEPVTKVDTTPHRWHFARNLNREKEKRVN